MGRIVGIDYGLARIGIAISDESQTIASPFKLVKAKKNLEVLAEEIINCIVASYDVETIVIGLPLHMNGQFNSKTDEVYHFIDIMKQFTNLPIETWDERLTTLQAEKSMRQANMSRKKRSKVIDVTSAIIILQSYLDKQKNSLLNSI